MVETTIAAIRLSTTLLGSLLYTTDLSQEGNWYYDSSDLISNDNTGTVLVSASGHRYKRIYTGAVFPEWFGAVCDGLTDSTVAINRLIGFPDIEFSFGLGYAVTSTIEFPSTTKRLIMNSPLILTVDVNVPLVVIGDSLNKIQASEFKIDVVRKTAPNWESEGSDNCIGIKVINCYSSNINVFRVSGFKIGAVFIGKGAGFVYNTVFLNMLMNNKIHIDLTNESIPGENPGDPRKIGWCNENVYIGGRFANLIANKGQTRYGVRITSVDGTYVNNNNNVFIKPSFELRFDNSTPAEAVPILIEHGSNNTFRDIRNESNSTTTARILNESTENEVTTGFGAISVEELGLYPNTRKVSSRQKVITQSNNVVHNSGSLSRLAVLYNGIDTINVPGMHATSSSGSTIEKAINGITINEGYLEVSASRGLGIFVDSSISKQFVIRRGVKDGLAGRINVRCYDESGTILNDTGLGHPYVKSAVNMILTYFNVFGGAYRTGSDSGSDVLFTVGPEVKSFALIFSGGTAAAKLTSFSITSVDGRNPQVWSGINNQTNQFGIVLAPPTTGIWEKGTTLYNANPITGQPQGWVCSVTGSPGTWLPLALIGP